MKKHDIEKLYTVTQEEFEKNVDEIMAKMEKGFGPVRIKAQPEKDILMLPWSEAKNLYTPEEIAAIEEACRSYKEDVK